MSNNKYVISLKIVIQRLLQLILACTMTVLVLMIIQPVIPSIESFLIFLLGDLSSNQFIFITAFFIAVVLEEFFRKAIMPLGIWVTLCLIVMLIGVILSLMGFKKKETILRNNIV